MERRIHFHVLVGLLIAVGAWMTTPAPAVTVIANFDGGGSDAVPVTNVVDAYTGMTGDGWAGAWGKITGNGGTITAAVKQPGEPGFSEIAGGGNYLSYSLASTGISRGAIGRKYTDGVDVAQSHTVSFKYRIDEDLSATFADTTYDFFQMYDYPTLRTGSAAGCSWQISGVSLGLWPGTWTALDGDHLGGGTPVDTGIALAQGAVYDFQINLNATTKTWDLWIDNGTTVFDSKVLYPAGMGWRTSAATVGGFVQFFSRASDSADVRQFSLDSLSIVGQPVAPQVPGPRMSPVAARFTAGNTGTEVDGYVGMPGAGWKTAWNAPTSNAATNHVVVSSGDAGYSEIKPGQGAYLSFSATGTGGTMNATVARNYKTIDPNPGITWTREHTIQFTMRIDEDVDNFFLFTDADDKYTAFNAPTAANGTGTACIWQVAAMAAESAGVAAEDVGKWLFFDGDHAGSGANVNTQIAIATGGIYDFTIIVDPATLTYDAVISDGANTWDSRTNGYANGLGWRSTATEVGGYLCFGARGNSFEDTRAFSLDDVIITQSQQTPGDADGNGTVDAADAAALAANWLGSGAGWAGGDFNNDGLTDDLDLAILAANWATGAADAAVPEPGTLLLLAAGLGALVMRRSRR